MITKYVLCDIAYGNGPYLQMAYLVVELRKHLLKKGIDLRLIMPGLYGERQKNILKEELEKEIEKDPEFLLIDKKYGKLLSVLEYRHESYEQYMKRYISKYDHIFGKIKEHFKGAVSARDMSGKRHIIHESEILFEISNLPRCQPLLKDSYYIGITLTSKILSEAKKHCSWINPKLLDSMERIMKSNESLFSKRIILKPGTFPKEEYEDVMFSPFIEPRLKPNNENIEKGIFITVSGIDGMKRLFKGIEKFGLKIYIATFSKLKIKAEKKDPKILSNKNILYHFARNGWASVKRSIYTETPLIMPKYENWDDPEIFFNERRILQEGWGIVFDSEEDPETILKNAGKCIQNYKKFKSKIRKEFNMINGPRYCAEIIIKDLEKRSII